MTRDIRIKKLKDLVEQVKDLQNTASKLLAELGEQLDASQAKSDADRHTGDRRKKR